MATLRHESTTFPLNGMDARRLRGGGRSALGLSDGGHLVGQQRLFEFRRGPRAEEPDTHLEVTERRRDCGAFVQRRAFDRSRIVDSPMRVQRVSRPYWAG